MEIMGQISYYQPSDEFCQWNNLTHAKIVPPDSSQMYCFVTCTIVLVVWLACKKN